MRSLWGRYAARQLSRSKGVGALRETIRVFGGVLEGLQITHRRPSLPPLGYKSLDLIITLQVILITTTCLGCAVPSPRAEWFNFTRCSDITAAPQPIDATQI